MSRLSAFGLPPSVTDHPSRTTDDGSIVTPDRELPVEDAMHDGTSPKIHHVDDIHLWLEQGSSIEIKAVTWFGHPIELSATHRHRHAFFGQHGIDLCLRIGAQVDEFAPLADELTELSQVWRCRPTFGSGHPMRSRSTRSVASSSSFFTRRLPQLLPSGRARCTYPPHSSITSAALYHP